MNKPLLICTDLDRTLLPNGAQPESPQARSLFSRIAQRKEVDLAYVTGRHLQLVQDAITEYELPQPDYILSDVGTSIYLNLEGHWKLWQDWLDEIAPCWNNYQHHQLAAKFSDIAELQLQEDVKQNQYKLSYYVSLDVDHQALIQVMQHRCTQLGIDASLVWSIDEATHIGLLDLIPAIATKLHAIEYLIKHKQYRIDTTLFAGDSGNDLAVLSSRILSVVVANASDNIKQQSISLSQAHANTSAIYIAQGNFMDMNGNYSAGILEGLAHYFPETLDWMQESH